jgi:outer membrane protein assembly factor BamB
MDDWPHFLHGANGNAVADDTIVDTPYHMQWAGGPRYARTHEGVSTVNVAVSDGKRLYYIADDATEALPHQIPSEWTLIARDAFNGIVLWKRPLERWQARSDGSRHNYPPDLFRRLVAGQQHVYATLDILGPAAALDPATGKTIHVYKDSEGTEEILYDDGVLYLVVNTTPTEKIDRGLLATKIPASQPKRIMAFDAKTARLLWSKEGIDTVGLVTMSTAVKDGNLVYQNADNVICLDAATGEIRWQTERLTPTIRPVWGTTTLVIADDVVLSADRKVGKAEKVSKKKLEKAKSAEKMEILALSNNASELIAYDLKTGKELWKTATEEGSHIPNELFVVDGLVWAGEKSSRSQQDYQLGRDIHTGEVKVTIPDSDAWTSEHHHRCYRDKATSRFILAGRTGVEFIDLRAGDIASHHWIRGICKFGVLPCNGLIYIPPNQCSCYQESLLNGFNALAPKSRTMDIDFPTKAEKLEKGPAYGKIENRKSKKANPSDWATYRYDAARSGSTLERVSKSLKQAWQTKISAPITAPVVAAGRVYVAAKDRHMLYALDSRSGDIKWSYIAGGRIDSPPTIADGYAVFGCRDGYVYAIRAEDGVLVWRYQAAPADRQLVAHGQCESVWPVHGSVLIEDGRVYFAAGRYSHLDGGVICSIVDLETGKKIEEQRHYSRQPGTGGQKSLYEPFDGALLPGRELPGVSPDVPSSDGKFVFMRSVAYDRAFKPADEYVQHLFSSTGFLDDAWYQRLFWIYGNHMFSGLSGRGFNKKYTSAGRMLVEDIDMVFGYRDYTLEGEGVFAIEKTSTLGVFDSQFPPAKQTKDKFKEKIPAERWHLDVPFYVRAMIGADSSLILAGPPKYEPEAAHEEIGSLGLDTIPPSPLLQKALDAWRGKLGGKLWIVNKKDGTRQAELELASPPVHDGIAVANGKLYICGMDGSIRCLEGK